jgi:very-short-patch-repair endonuclease
MPACELILRSRLRGRQIYDCKFRRQFSFGPYCFDLYCPELKLAIEIDGDSHFGDGAEARDAARQAYIEAFGVRFLRFTNVDVRKSLYVVVNRIGDTILQMRTERHVTAGRTPL